ncbi:hypothetical protein Mapa_004154 [Marchantia paleacea]|nr:hypothetical protein Mapa_004154 [Marchantia paleacea]
MMPKNLCRSADHHDATNAASSSASVLSDREGSWPAAASTTTAGEMGTDVDPEVWGERHIPEEVIHTILAWLPLRSYWRLRAVCKSWNESALSSCFRKICQHGGRCPLSTSTFHSITSRN